MKDKLEPNMYVRTKWGYICKIININDFREPNMKYGVEASYLKDIMFIGDDDILKARHKIINILEVGDYVNGYPIYEIIEYEDNTRAIVIGDDNKSIIWEESSQYIKSVITHELMEQMAYKVGE